MQAPQPDAAAAAAGGGEDDAHDRFLPVANIARVMKRCLPPSAKVAKDAKESMQMCVSEFISFITSDASERCQHDRRKTLYGDDLVRSLTALGFEAYAEPLNTYLERIRESEIPRGSSGSRKRKAPGAGAAVGDGAGGGGGGGADGQQAEDEVDDEMGESLLTLGSALTDL